MPGSGAVGLACQLAVLPAGCSPSRSRQAVAFILSGGGSGTHFLAMALEYLFSCDLSLRLTFRGTQTWLQYHQGWRSLVMLGPGPGEQPGYHGTRGGSGELPLWP